MKYFILTIILITSLITQAQDKAQLFERGLISDDGVFGFTLSPDGKEAFWVRSKGKRDSLVIVQSVKVNGKWQVPQVASFSSKQFLWKDIDPIFTPDGNTILFQSNRAVENRADRKRFDMWAVKKENNRWSEPYHLGNTLNSDSSESFASMAKNGNMYFTFENGAQQGDIFVSEYVNGQYQTPRSIGAVINTGFRESNPFISPDDDYLIFVAPRSDDPNNFDLFITFRDRNTWGKPVNLGEQINTSASEFCPFIHAKEDRIYFTRMTKTADRNIENVYYYEGISVVIKKLRAINAAKK
jgi:Tol biopolymer transport system component